MAFDRPKATPCGLSSLITSQTLDSKCCDKSWVPGALRCLRAETESSHELQRPAPTASPELIHSAARRLGELGESRAKTALEETMDTDLQEAQKELLEEPVEYISRKEQELWQECWCARRRNTSPSSSCTAAELASA